MIPEFPKFKKVELADREILEKIIKKYPPYSDFNFLSLWCWDIFEKRKISLLGNNLVVQFTDYIGTDQFFSVLGKPTEHDIHRVLAFARENNFLTRLEMVPETSIEHLEHIPSIHMDEDRDNFDYIFDIELLIKKEGSSFATYRNMMNRCRTRFPHIEVHTIAKKDKHIEQQILDLFSDWADQKTAKEKDVEENEWHALKRLLSLPHWEGLVIQALYEEKKMIGVSIAEILAHDYAIVHFSKTNLNFPGLAAVLMDEQVKFLKECGIVLLNYEQDLGVPSLRHSKNSYRPVKFLKKYIIQEKA